MWEVRILFSFTWRSVLPVLDVSVTRLLVVTHSVWNTIPSIIAGVHSQTQSSRLLTANCSSHQFNQIVQIVQEANLSRGSNKTKDICKDRLCCFVKHTMHLSFGLFISCVLFQVLKIEGLICPFVENLLAWKWGCISHIWAHLHCFLCTGTFIFVQETKYFLKKVTWWIIAFQWFNQCLKHIQMWARSSEPVPRDCSSGKRPQRKESKSHLSNTTTDGNKTRRHTTGPGGGSKRARRNHL